jgi:hypothetical protein
MFDHATVSNVLVIDNNHQAVADRTQYMVDGYLIVGVGRCVQVTKCT